MIQGKVYICQGLRLHALRRVNHENRPVARGKASGHFIVKIHVSRRIDQVEHILLPVLRLVNRTHCLCLDRDSSLPLQVHIVQHLRLHLTTGQKPRHLDDPVRQRGLSVINMCDNTKISDFTLIYN